MSIESFGSTIGNLIRLCSLPLFRFKIGKTCICYSFFYYGCAFKDGLQIIWRTCMDKSCFLWRWCSSYSHPRKQFFQTNNKINCKIEPSIYKQNWLLWLFFVEVAAITFLTVGKVLLFFAAWLLHLFVKAPLK